MVKVPWVCRWCVALWLSGWVCALSAQVEKPLSPDAVAKPLMQAKQVVPHVYYVQGMSEMGSSANQNFISNAGFVVTPAGVVVIDALGSPELGRRLLAEIAKVGFDPVFGARPLKRAIQQRIENPLSKLLLEGKFSPKDTVHVDVDPIQAPGQFSFQ